MSYKEKVERLAKKLSWKYVYKSVLEKQHRGNGMKNRNHGNNVKFSLDQSIIKNAVSSLVLHKKGIIKAGAPTIAKFYDISKMTLYRHYHKWQKHPYSVHRQENLVNDLK